MQQSLVAVPGSLADTATANGHSLAESFVSADAIIICDVSGSMATYDARGRRMRYEVALEELAALQARLSGRVAVIAFSDDVLFVPGGQPPLLGMGTDLTRALRFAKVADVEGIRFVLISDGVPDSENDALAVAKTYSNQIDVVYVGPEAQPYGRAFLERLAAATGGQAVTADRLEGLAETTMKLLQR